MTCQPIGLKWLAEFNTRNGSRLPRTAPGGARNPFRWAAPLGQCVLGCALASAMFASLDSAQAKSTNEEVVYSFCSVTKCADGAEPVAGLISDSSGNLYGTTLEGGANSAGTVFQVSVTGQETVLYSFCSKANCTDGAEPVAGLISDSSGNLYGTTQRGGKRRHGTVFEVSPNGQETVLYSFCSVIKCADGAEPVAGLISDSSGNLYGTTLKGGAYGAGTVFEVSPNGQETELYSFCSKANCTDGAAPFAGLISDSSGNLYGTTEKGGKGTACGGYPCGTVFKLAPGGGETVLHSFKGGRDGEYPEAGLIMDRAGNLYGTSFGGGAASSTVFEVTAQGKETVLYSFCSLAHCADGDAPKAGLIMDKKGNVYGTTWSGGIVGGNCSGGCGVVFELAPAGEGAPNAKETVLYSFTGGSDGAYPYAGLIADGSGNVYGTTRNGGNAGCGGRGCGVVFKVPKQ